MAPEATQHTNADAGDLPTDNLYLFVSHVNEDRSAAVELVNELERRSIRCWIAPRDVEAGKPFDDEIADAIEGSRAMLLVFSERCNDSVYIRREVTVASDFKKIIIPFRIEDVKPKKGLSVRLADLQWIDGFIARERGNAIDEVLRAVRPKGRHNGSPEKAATPPIAPALATAPIFPTSPSAELPRPQPSPPSLPGNSASAGREQVADTSDAAAGRPAATSEKPGFQLDLFSWLGADASISSIMGLIASFMLVEASCTVLRQLLRVFLHQAQASALSGLNWMTGVAAVITACGLLRNKRWALLVGPIVCAVEVWVGFASAGTFDYSTAYRSFAFLADIYISVMYAIAGGIFILMLSGDAIKSRVKTAFAQPKISKAVFVMLVVFTALAWISMMLLLGSEYGVDAILIAVLSMVVVYSAYKTYLRPYSPAPAR